MNRLLNFLKGKWLGHPLHPIVVHVPMAMWPGALIFDLLSKWQIGGNAMVRLSFYAIVFCLIASLLAVPTGLVDWTGIKREKPAWKIGLYHLALNVVVTALFAINLVLRLQDFRDASIVATAPLTLSILGTAILIVSAYLGGRMTYHYGISEIGRASCRERVEIGAVAEAVQKQVLDSDKGTAQSLREE